MIDVDTSKAGTTDLMLSAIVGRQKQILKAFAIKVEVYDCKDKVEVPEIGDLLN